MKHIVYKLKGLSVRDEATLQLSIVELENEIESLNLNAVICSGGYKF